jgi:hypothetical protein
MANRCHKYGQYLKHFKWTYYALDSGMDNTWTFRWTIHGINNWTVVFPKIIEDFNLDVGKTYVTYGF